MLRRPFRFYNVWTKAEIFLSLVQHNWDKPVQGCMMYRVVQRLKWLQSNTNILNKNGFSVVEADNKKCRDENSRLFS